MRVESVDFFYLAMPTIVMEGDGSQDVLLVRARGAGHEGWGECEASPLVSIAAAFCPGSHSACRPALEAVLGAKVDSPADISRINRSVREIGLDLLQTDHTLSGIDVALWDLLARSRGVPVWDLMGAKRNLPKVPYASVLFGESPERTLEKARAIRKRGFVAAKFGWANFGAGTLQNDRDQVEAARAGLGPEADLMIDVGTVWVDRLEAAIERIGLLESAKVTWLEEPFVSGALDCYSELARRAPGVPLAAGEGSHNFWMARHLIEQGGVKFIQIDAGRIGGITTSRAVAEFVERREVAFVNHTFTSQLALSASMQAFVDQEKSHFAEYPIECKAVCRDLTAEAIEPDQNGLVRVPETPGLGIRPRRETIEKYLKQVRIEVDGHPIYQTPESLD